MDRDPSLLNEAVENVFGSLRDPQSYLFSGFTGCPGSAREGQEDIGVFELNLRFGVDVPQT
jgi:hypothetical protein